MTSQIFNIRVFAVAICLMASININAQEPMTMRGLLKKTLSKIQQDRSERQRAGEPEDSGMVFMNCIAELKRIDAMFPDSIQPKYQIALQSLIFSVTYPHAGQTNNLLAEAEQTIHKMEQMKGADLSDIYTLRGFLYMVRIVQDPARNGHRYYLDVLQDYEKALKINPDNQLAKQLQEKFYEGMKNSR